MYSGTLSCVVKTDEQMKGIHIGGVLYAPSGSITNIYGGTICDGISASVGTKLKNCGGGNIYTGGSFAMTAGTVRGGMAYNNSCIEQDPTNPILDEKGKATTLIGYGGSIHASALNMTGGRIVGGIAKTGVGGNIYISKDQANYLTVEPGDDGAATVIANGTGILKQPQRQLPPVAI